MPDPLMSARRCFFCGLACTAAAGDDAHWIRLPEGPAHWSCFANGPPGWQESRRRDAEEE